MYDEYRRFWTQYSKQYGQRTAVFIQVGSFYELYDVQYSNGKTEFNVKEIIDFLGIQLTIKKDDHPNGPDTCGLFAGFPDYVLHKWAGKLTAVGWTVIVVNQYKDKHGKVIERKVARILTAGTHIEALSGSEAPTVVSLWIEPSATEAPKYGAASFDLSTGSTYITSGQMRGTPEAYSSDELLHFLSVFAPRELLVFWRSASTPPTEDILRKQLDYQRHTNSMHIRSAADQGSLEVPLVREQYLQRLFTPKSLLSVRQYLGLTAEPTERALCSLLRFIEDYQPSSFHQLQQTLTWSPDSLLLLGNHALNQLQILPSTEGGVLDLFKYTATTSFGKRALKTRLLTPSASSKIIEERLNEVDTFRALPDSKINRIFKNLRLIYDLPRLHRKMLCADIGAPELLNLQSSYAAIEDIFEVLSMPEDRIRELSISLQSNFDLDAAASGQPYLPVARHPKIGELLGQIKEEEQELTAFLTVLRGLAASETGIRYESAEKVPYKLTGTKTALGVLKGAMVTSVGKTQLEKLPKEQRDFTIHLQKSSGGYIESAWLDRINGRLIGLRERLQIQMALEVPDVCKKFCEETEAYWSKIESSVATIDISIGLATESKARNWCRPTILTSPQGGLKAQGLRHPLIEELLQKTRYVAHNVELGSTCTTNGWLVYGMNASGKSSLMKSIGIAVHLAQAGCYVPATQFELSPYRSLFTRILNQDNLWAGLSSFAVEMTEMRDILRAADQRTLVLGDELCAGTESVSAKALVAAGIEWLAERGSSYIFATHLHGLTDVLPTPEDIALKVWHLKVTTDPYTGKLIYHRNLEPGAGSSLYGLEVAKAMDVPLAFLDKAHQIRRKLLGVVSEEEAPRSAWNSAVVRRACEICGSSAVANLEVHHIRPRAEGGDNHISNLMVLCAACHDRHHAALEVSPASVPLTVTSEGNERIINNVEKPSSEFLKKKKGFSPEENIIITKELADYPNLPVKKMVARLNMLHGINVSEATIRKMKNC